MSQKRGTIMGLVDRAFLLSHSEFYQKNLEFIIGILLNNDYPLNFIFKIMTDIIKSLINKNLNKVRLSKRLIKQKQLNGSRFYTLVIFLKNSKRSLCLQKLKLAYHNLNKLSKFIKVHKDPLSNLQKKNVVYKICCNDCDASYVAQTEKLLKTRISKYRNHIRNSPTASIITNHVMHHNHDLDWNNVETLDVEKYYHKRLVSEML